MLINYLLEKNELQQIDIYHQLKEQGSLPLSQLRQKNDLKTGQLDQLLDSIQKILTQIDPTIQLSYESKTVCLPPTAPFEQVFRQTVLQQSLISQVLLFMLSYPDKNLMDFCQKTYVSRATVFRRLTKFHSLLETFQVRLNVSQLTFCGKERCIRYLLLALFLLIKPDLNQIAPLTSPNKKMLGELSLFFDPLTILDRQKILALPLQIGELRRKAGFFINKKIDLEELPLPKELLQLQETTLKSYLATSTPDFYLEKEYNAFYFFLYASPVYTHYDTQIFTAFQKWCQEKHENQQIIHRLCEKIAKHFFTGHPPEAFSLIEANLLCILNTSQILGYTPPFGHLELEKNLRQRSLIYRQVDCFCTSYLQSVAKRKDYAWIIPNIASLASSFAYLLSPSVIAHSRHKSIRVAIFAENNFISTMPLYLFLCNQPEVKLVSLEQLATTTLDLVIIQQGSSFPYDYQGPSYLYTSQDVLTNFANLASCLHHLQKAGITPP